MPRNNEDLDPKEAMDNYQRERAETLARERARELALADEVERERDQSQ